MNLKFSHILIIIGVLGYGAQKYWSRPKGPPLKRFTEQAGDPCFKKEKCVVVYLAPWCPACNASVETLKEMNRLWNANDSKYTRGIKVLVGQDTMVKCQEKADSIGTFAQIDSDDKFSKLYGISGYPTWFVFDANGKELKRVPGAFTEPSQADLIAEQVLKL
jgi:thiol-disulfide isomerase/thioredoxin